MQNINIHKQKLIAIIIAVIIIIFCFLPWQRNTAQGYTGANFMGFVSWGGIIAAIVAAGIIANSFLGNKTQPFTKQSKMIAMACFGLIVISTIITVIVVIGTEKAQTQFGEIVEIKHAAGIGAWLALAASLIGLVWVSGILDQLMQQKMVTAGSTPPTAPPPPPKS